MDSLYTLAIVLIIIYIFTFLVESFFAIVTVIGWVYMWAVALAGNLLFLMIFQMMIRRKEDELGLRK